MNEDVAAFATSGAQRIVRAVRTVEGANQAGPAPNAAGGRGHEHQQAFYHVTASNNDGTHTVKRQEWSDPAGGSLRDLTDANDPEYGLSETAWEFRGQRVAAGQYVLGFRLYVQGLWIVIIASILPKPTVDGQLLISKGGLWTLMDPPDGPAILAADDDGIATWMELGDEYLVLENVGGELVWSEVHAL